MGNFRNKGCEENITQSAVEPGTGDKPKIENLVARSVNGDADAFGELYVMHVEKIYRYVFYHVYNRTESEDITQEVFLKAWRAISSCRGKEKTFSSWLYRIAHNQMVDTIRKRQRHQSVRIETVENISATTSGVEGYLEQQELLRVLECLSPNQRQVIVLKFIEGLDNHEIADTMGKSEGAIRILQMRALSALKKELSKG